MTAIRNRVLHDAFSGDNMLMRDIRGWLPSDVVSEIDSLFGLHGIGLMTLVEGKRLVDLRLSCFLFRGFRKYASPSVNDYQWYGLPAVRRDRQPASLILLGENGSGKSSLFDAMEHMWTGTISEAHYRGFDRIKDYLHNGEGIEPDAHYYTIADKYDFNTARSAINVDVAHFFLSEGSIQRLSCSLGDVGNWFPFFCECLGMVDLYYFSQGKGVYENIVEVLTKRVETPAVSSSSFLAELRKNIRRASLFLSSQSQRSVQHTIDNCRTILTSIDGGADVDVQEAASRVVIPSALRQIRVVKAWSAAIATIPAGDDAPIEDSVFNAVKPTPLEQFTSALTALITGLETYLVEGRNDALRQLSETLTKYNAAIDAEANLTQSDRATAAALLRRVEIFRKALSARIIAEVKAFIDDSFASMIKDVFREKFLKEGESIDIDLSRIDSGVISVQVLLEGGGKRVTFHPSKYFNTFRFRLFFITLQAALCIRMMVVLGFRFPIVIDDIFYANDYRNKAELRHFFAVMDEAAERVLGDRLLLQLLFFTHDEQLVTALRLSNVGSEGNLRFARIVDSRNAEALLTARCSEGEESEKYINLISMLYE